MVKKTLNIILILLIIFSLFTTIYGIYIIYSYKHKIDVALSKAEIEISNEKITTEEPNQSTNNEVTDTNNENDNAIGIITFPNNKKIAIYNNPTNHNIDIGLGKIINGSILNESGNSILLGHRDGTANELKNINIGDIIKIKTSEKTLEYKVYDTYITEKDNPTPYKNTEEIMITLITCYPFTYVGDAPKRYIVKAKLLT